MARLDEIQAVKQLGKTIGYGNMMDIASALWALEMEREYGISGGMHVPTVMPYLTEEGKQVAEESLSCRILELKDLGL